MRFVCRIHFRFSFEMRLFMIIHQITKLLEHVSGIARNNAIVKIILFWNIEIRRIICIRRTEYFRYTIQNWILYPILFDGNHFIIFQNYHECCAINWRGLERKINKYISFKISINQKITCKNTIPLNRWMVWDLTSFHFLPGFCIVLC